MRSRTLLISLVSVCAAACANETQDPAGPDASVTGSTTAVASNPEATGSVSGAPNGSTTTTGPSSTSSSLPPEQSGTATGNPIPGASTTGPAASNSGAGGDPNAVPPDGSAIAGNAGVPIAGAGGEGPGASSTTTSIAPVLDASAPPPDDSGAADAQVPPVEEPDDAGPIEPLPELTISSDTASIEFTPALYAAENLYPGVATVITGGIPLLLSDDSVDLGTNAETQTLRRSVERPDLRIIFTVTETFYRVIARRSAGIESIEDLAGKTVGTPAQTSAAYYVYKTLGLAGLEIGTGPDQVTVTSVFPGQQMVTALAGANPTVDAIAAWEPYPQLALDELGGEEGDAIVFQDRSVYREIVNLHSTTAKLEDPVIRRGIVYFVRSLMDAAKWYRDNPALAQEYVADELGHEADLMARVWPDEQFAGVLADDLVDVLEVEELWLAEQEDREPRTRQELAPLVDTSIYEEALALP